MIHIPKELINVMIKETNRCISQYPHLQDHPYHCESVYWNTYQDENSYTLHTHTIPEATEPSQADKRTTHNLKKQNLCIINTANGTLSCWNQKDNFKTKVLHRKI